MNTINYNLRQKYKNIVKLIAEKVDNKNDKRYIKKNFEIIVSNLIELSNYIDNITNIVLEKHISYKDKVVKIQNIRKKKISKKNAKIILDKFLLKDLKGGNLEKVKNHQEYKTLNKVSNLCLSNLPQLMFKIFIASPGLLLSIPTYLTKSFLNIFGIECCEPTDYKKPLGITYLILFFMASVPIIGGFSDFIIIIKSLKNGRFFLATITLISRFMSHLLTMSFVDLGLLFKVFYSMDTLSVRKYSKKSPEILKQEEKEYELMKKLEKEKIKKILAEEKSNRGKMNYKDDSQKKNIKNEIVSKKRTLENIKKNKNVEEINMKEILERKNNEEEKLEDIKRAILEEKKKLEDIKNKILINKNILKNDQKNLESRNQSQKAEFKNKALDNISNKISNKLDKASDKISNKAKQISDRISNKTDKLVNKVSDKMLNKADKFSDKMLNKADKVSDKVSKRILDKTDKMIDKLDKVSDKIIDEKESINEVKKNNEINFRNNLSNVIQEPSSVGQSNKMTGGGELVFNFEDEIGKIFQ